MRPEDIGVQVTMDQFHSTYLSAKESKKIERKRKKSKSKDLYLCDKCAQTFDKFSELEIHQCIHTYNIDLGSYMCAICGKIFRYERDLTDHELAHSPTKTFDCKECGAMFSKGPDLNQHRKSHRKDKYQCQCGQSFPTKGELVNHIKTHARKVKANKKEKTAALKLKKSGPSTDSRTDIPEGNVTSKGRRRRQGSFKKYTCKICGKTYLKLIRLYVHILSHKGKKCFKCKKCGETFAYKRELNRHVNDQRIHCRCRNCLSDSKQNEDSEDSDAGTYQCSFCDREFVMKKTLYDHMKVHEDDFDEMMIRTETTDEIQRDVTMEPSNGPELEATVQMMNHEELQIAKGCDDTDQREVEETGSGEQEETELVEIEERLEKSKRKRTHTRQELSCDQCNETFTTKRKLKKHVQSHVGRKPYVCVTCGKTCTQLGQINIHVLLDKGIKDFKCEECLTLEFIRGPVSRGKPISST